MRFCFLATAVSLCLIPLGLILAAPPSATKPNTTPGPPTTLPTSAAATADGFAADAAARHAKRTECLKQAKAKKLVGPNKDAYVKDCLGAP